MTAPASATTAAPVGDAPQSIVIVGPTASGKSRLALELAELLGECEIVSVDSMQVYREMDIGTAKATAEDQRRIPHHLVDLVDPDADFSVAWFQTAAFAVLDELAATGRRAILVGGTGLYHRAVIDRLQIPGQFPKVRAALDAEESTEVLHRRLSALDSVAASRTEPTNRRRIVRALEVTIGADRPFSSFGPGLEEYPETDHLIIGLDVARDRLGGLVGDRVEQMMVDGFLDEVTALAARPAGISRTAAQALGYRELLAHLAGEASLDDAVADTVRRTRQFAVRQDRWFRRDPRTLWFDSETRSLPQRIADTLEQR